MVYKYFWKLIETCFESSKRAGWGRTPGHRLLPELPVRGRGQAAVVAATPAQLINRLCHGPHLAALWTGGLVSHHRGHRPDGSDVLFNEGFRGHCPHGHQEGVLLRPQLVPESSCDVGGSDMLAHILDTWSGQVKHPACN